MSTTIRVTLERTTDHPADDLARLLEQAPGWRLTGSVVQVAGRSIVHGVGAIRSA